MPHLYVSVVLFEYSMRSPTFVRVLSRELRHGISHLASHRCVRLLRKATQ